MKSRRGSSSEKQQEGQDYIERRDGLESDEDKDVKLHKESEEIED